MELENHHFVIILDIDSDENFQQMQTFHEQQNI